MKGLNINDLIGQLHGRNNIQHICGFNDLLGLKKVEVGQAGSTNQNLKPNVWHFFEFRQDLISR